jgi:hypothetical protein
MHILAPAGEVVLIKVYYSITPVVSQDHLYMFRRHMTYAVFMRRKTKQIEAFYLKYPIFRYKPDAQDDI